LRKSKSETNINMKRPKTVDTITYTYHDPKYEINTDKLIQFYKSTHQFNPKKETINLPEHIVKKYVKEPSFDKNMGSRLYGLRTINTTRDTSTEFKRSQSMTQNNFNKNQ